MTMTEKKDQSKADPKNVRKIEDDFFANLE